MPALVRCSVVNEKDWFGFWPTDGSEDSFTLIES